MHRLAIVLLLASAGSLAAAKPRAAPVPVTSAPVTPGHVTVDQLDQLLASLSQRSDAGAARAIAALELTERPSRDEVERWEGKLPGKRASEALCALTDAAAFLNPPPADLPADPPPEIATQNQIVAQAQDYVIHTLHKLPNFSALRSATGFELAAEDDLASQQATQDYFGPKSSKLPHQDRPQYLGPASAVPSGGLYLDGVWEHLVTYRDGSEVADAPEAAGASGRSGLQELATNGEFGPILYTVLDDMVHGKVIWSHWERNAPSTLAVFHYEVPRVDSHYSVQTSANSPIEQPAYRGEIAIDPATGAIFRISIQAWLREPGSAYLSGILVEYGMVTIGGSPYICPVHAVAYLNIYPPFIDEDAQPAPVPRHEYINDVLFTQYHVFRSESRILPGGPGF
jgi:hypothetical protein